MWNKLFKSKSKSSKNLSTSSSSHSNGGGPSSSPPLDLVPIYNIDNRIRYGDDDFEPAADDVELRRNHNRDSIGPQMCGIPMRKSKFSSAFKSLSLRRGSTKNQLKLYPGEATPVDESPTSVEDIQISAKRASLRPSKSDNNLNEKQNYADQEKEDPVYEQQQQQYRPPDPFLEIPDPPEHLELQPCPICARNFVPTSLVKHIAICERMQSKKRKPFDSSRQRREGTELASYLPKNFGLPQNHPQARVSPPKTTNPVRKLSTSKTPTPERKDYSGAGSNNNSMSTSQTLATMSSSGGGGGGSNTHQTTATGATTPRPILKRSLSQQNEPCPYCERCFGFKAYDRHVEWCREKALLNKNIQHHQSSVAKERLQARIQYKAPQLKSKRALNREKYSGSLSCGGSTSSLADLDLPFPRHRSHLNSMSSSLSSDNKSDHSGSLKKIPSNDPGAVGYAGDRRGGTLPGKKREIRANLLENENFRNDSNNNNSNPTGKIFGNNLLIRSTQDVRREKEQAVSVERVERLELVATGRAGEQRVPLKRGATKIVKCNKSGYTPDRYDPFLSAKRQLEELFSPTSSFNTSTKQQQQTSNSRVTSPVTPSPTQVMSKSVVVPATTKTTSPNMNLSNFRRASSLRMPRKVSRPMFIEKAKSNIQKGITDDGPVSPNFLKSSEYDEIPIKSVFNAAQMAEKPKMRDSSSVRRNLKLDIKDPNMPATDVPLSKTDSLAVFLKYEHELNLLMSEKEMKDKSNSLSKRSASLTGHERKETYSPSVNSKSNERSSPSEKEKSEKPVQEIQPIKKVPQKLVPIKLDPINITYNNNNSNSTSKPTVISLDAILGKSSTKPKAPPPEEKLMTRKESTNYIDPKLINRCDNLPIMVNKLTKPDLIETKPTVVATTIPKVSPEPPKRLNGTSPETEGGGGKAADNRLSDLSTKSDDSKPTLTRQNGTSASRSSESSSIGDSSREPSPPSQRSEHKPNQDAKSQSPDSGVERSTPTKQPASTPIGVQKPERPPLPSFDDFDFEEFISSFEDERRSFQNAFYSRNATSNNNNNSSTSSFNQRVTNNSFTDNSVKSAVNGSSTSNNNTSSPSHFAASKLNSSQSYYKPLNINGRSEEEETRQKSPQVPPRRHQPLPPPPEQPPSTIRNLPSIQPVVAKNLPGSPTPNNPNSIFSYGPPSNDTNNNNNSVKSSPSSTSRLGSGNNNSFNNSPLTATTHQPYQQQHQQHTTLPKTPSATNHMFSATPSPPPPPLANSAASNAFLDDLSPTERDLMKSVQELDRMCESSSSMYPADSDEVSSVEGYPLSGSRDGGQRGHRPSEGSKFSADSAYGSSLSRQSPNQQDSNHTHTVRRTHHHHHHRGGATSQQQQLLLQQDAFDNSSGSESSLPPITTATLKAQKIELHSHGSSTKLAAGPTATAAAAAMAASQMSKFCHECGSRFMISTAKFCMECGVRRIMLD
ncbi:uncharacterized protein LOC120425311 isoform X4 [Culex pipiens pallens]|uniref:uncharacterized protein LOC120425311 isoform X4 n=1 Tax=Culex pipiens pallens TaxID=42434 RepID=UPI0022AA77C5|nr:uncharacterized protein LOC120425311 isoform X4 [Culex pipiens pallens]